MKSPSFKSFVASVLAVASAVTWSAPAFALRPKEAVETGLEERLTVALRDGNPDEALQEVVREVGSVLRAVIPQSSPASLPVSPSTEPIRAGLEEAAPPRPVIGYFSPLTGPDAALSDRLFSEEMGTRAWARGEVTKILNRAVSSIVRERELRAEKAPHQTPMYAEFDKAFGRVLRLSRGDMEEFARTFLRLRDGFRQKKLSQHERALLDAVRRIAQDPGAPFEQPLLSYYDPARYLYAWLRQEAIKRFVDGSLTPVIDRIKEQLDYLSDGRNSENLGLLSDVKKKAGLIQSLREKFGEGRLKSPDGTEYEIFYDSLVEKDLEVYLTVEVVLDGGQDRDNGVILPLQVSIFGAGFPQYESPYPFDGVSSSRIDSRVGLLDPVHFINTRFPEWRPKRERDVYEARLKALRETGVQRQFLRVSNRQGNNPRFFEPFIRSSLRLRVPLLYHIVDAWLSERDYSNQGGIPNVANLASAIVMRGGLGVSASMVLENPGEAEKLAGQDLVYVYEKDHQRVEDPKNFARDLEMVLLAYAENLVTGWPSGNLQDETKMENQAVRDPWIAAGTPVAQTGVIDVQTFDQLERIYRTQQVLPGVPSSLDFHYLRNLYLHHVVDKLRAQGVDLTPYSEWYIEPDYALDGKPHTVEEMAYLTLMSWISAQAHGHKLGPVVPSYGNVHGASAGDPSLVLAGIHQYAAQAATVYGKPLTENGQPADPEAAEILRIARKAPNGLRAMAQEWVKSFQDEELRQELLRLLTVAGERTPEEEEQLRRFARDQLQRIDPQVLKALKQAELERKPLSEVAPGVLAELDMRIALLPVDRQAAITTHAASGLSADQLRMARDYGVWAANKSTEFQNIITEVLHLAYLMAYHPNQAIAELHRMPRAAKILEGATREDLVATADLYAAMYDAAAKRAEPALVKEAAGAKSDKAKTKADGNLAAVKRVLGGQEPLRPFPWIWRDNLGWSMTDEAGRDWSGEYEWATGAHGRYMFSMRDTMTGSGKDGTLLFPNAVQTLRAVVVRAAQAEIERTMEFYHQPPVMNANGGVQEYWDFMAAKGAPPRAGLEEVLLGEEVVTGEVLKRHYQQNSDKLVTNTESTQTLLDAVQQAYAWLMRGLEQDGVLSATAQDPQLAQKLVELRRTIPLFDRDDPRLHVLGPEEPSLESLLIKVFGHLLENAVDAVVQSGGEDFDRMEIRIQAFRGRDGLILRVLDSGAGIPDAFLGDHGMDIPFLSNKKKEDGLLGKGGLGIFIARWVSGEMGWELKLENRPGPSGPSGAQVSLRLPLVAEKLAAVPVAAGLEEVQEAIRALDAPMIGARLWAIRSLRRLELAGTPIPEVGPKLPSYLHVHTNVSYPGVPGVVSPTHMVWAAHQAGADSILLVEHESQLHVIEAYKAVDIVNEGREKPLEVAFGIEFRAPVDPDSLLGKALKQAGRGNAGWVVGMGLEPHAFRNNLLGRLAKQFQEAKRNRAKRQLALLRQQLGLNLALADVATPEGNITERAIAFAAAKAQLDPETSGGRLASRASEIRSEFLEKEPYLAADGFVPYENMIVNLAGYGLIPTLTAQVPVDVLAGLIPELKRIGIRALDVAGIEPGEPDAEAKINRIIGLAKQNGFFVFGGSDYRGAGTGWLQPAAWMQDPSIAVSLQRLLSQPQRAGLEEARFPKEEELYRKGDRLVHPVTEGVIYEVLEDQPNAGAGVVLTAPEAGGSRMELPPAQLGPNYKVVRNSPTGLEETGPVDVDAIRAKYGVAPYAIGVRQGGTNISTALVNARGEVETGTALPETGWRELPDVLALLGNPATAQEADQRIQDLIPRPDHVLTAEQNATARKIADRVTQEIVAHIVHLIRGTGLPIESFRYVHVAFPGPVDSDNGLAGVPYASANVPGFEAYPLAERIRGGLVAELGVEVQVRLRNDSPSGRIGEQSLSGTAAGLTGVVAMIWGTGMNANSDQVEMVEVGHALVGKMGPDGLWHYDLRDASRGRPKLTEGEQEIEDRLRGGVLEGRFRAAGFADGAEVTRKARADNPSTEQRKRARELITDAGSEMGRGIAALLEPYRYRRGAQGFIPSKFVLTSGVSENLGKGVVDKQGRDLLIGAVQDGAYQEFTERFGVDPALARQMAEAIVRTKMDSRREFAAAAQGLPAAGLEEAGPVVEARAEVSSAAALVRGAATPAEDQIFDVQAVNAGNQLARAQSEAQRMPPSDALPILAHDNGSSSVGLEEAQAALERLNAADGFWTYEDIATAQMRAVLVDAGEDVRLGAVAQALSVMKARDNVPELEFRLVIHQGMVELLLSSLSAINPEAAEFLAPRIVVFDDALGLTAGRARLEAASQLAEAAGMPHRTPEDLERFRSSGILNEIAEFTPKLASDLRDFFTAGGLQFVTDEAFNRLWAFLEAA